MLQIFIERCHVSYWKTREARVLRDRGLVELPLPNFGFSFFCEVEALGRAMQSENPVDIVNEIDGRLVTAATAVRADWPKRLVSAEFMSTGERVILNDESDRPVTHDSGVFEDEHR